MIDVIPSHRRFPVDDLLLRTQEDTASHGQLPLPGDPLEPGRTQR